VILFWKVISIVMANQINHFDNEEHQLGITKTRTVVIDPGHGGTEDGAISVTGIREADYVLGLSLRIKEKLEENENINVVLTRTEDIHVPLEDRARLANELQADVFISIHANAATTDKLWGIETYSMDTASDGGARRVAMRENAFVGDPDGSNNELLGNLTTYGNTLLSVELAEQIQNGVVEGLRKTYPKKNVRDLGNKTALFYVLVKTDMPSILFEAGFLTNAQEERQLRSAHYQDAMAEAFAEELIKWLERME
jgi:N-acetylmuramoyl-L-alanine amidase